MGFQRFNSVHFLLVSLVPAEGSDHPIQTQTLRLSCHLCRWSGKCCMFFLCNPNVNSFGETVSLVTTFGQKNVIICRLSFFTTPVFVLIHAKDRGLMDIGVQWLWHWHTLLSAVLSLQAYAVQGQHAIPQPDVSEGPSVSDPIYLKVQSWGAMSPSYSSLWLIFFPTSAPLHGNQFKQCSHGFSLTF